MNRVEKIIEAMETYTGAADAFGLRSDDRTYSIGDVLPASRVWLDNAPTGELLDGTSVTGLRRAQDVERVLKLHEKVYNYGQRMYLVAGDLVEYGQDAGEYILADPVVIEVL